jgi:hypothetical protein
MSARFVIYSACYLMRCLLVSDHMTTVVGNVSHFFQHCHHTSMHPSLTSHNATRHLTASLSLPLSFCLPSSAIDSLHESQHFRSQVCLMASVQKWFKRMLCILLKLSYYGILPYIDCATYTECIFVRQNV